MALSIFVNTLRDALRSDSFSVNISVIGFMYYACDEWPTHQILPLLCNAAFATCARDMA